MGLSVQLAKNPLDGRFILKDPWTGLWDPCCLLGGQLSFQTHVWTRKWTRSPLHWPLRMNGLNLQQEKK